MFEILWVAPYDRRRSNAALSGFERCSRETAVLLAATDLRSAMMSWIFREKTVFW